LPVEGLALLLGIDRFMSEARAIVNLIGNGVATVALARWENELDHEQLRRTLGGAGAEISPSRDGRDVQHPGGSDH
jgi:aerobic C4-dicarboxylate transport protein